MIDTIQFNGNPYPTFQSQGNASQFAIPYAKHVCRGIGYDIGCGKIDWSFPGSIPIDPVIDSLYHANNLPFDNYGYVDYVYSSHCLEHITGSWFETLAYWVENLKPHGTLFLYLPDFSQEYWRPWNNKKHHHVFTPSIVKEALLSLPVTNIFVSQVDLNNSFMAMAQRTAE